MLLKQSNSISVNTARVILKVRAQLRSTFAAQRWDALSNIQSAFIHGTGLHFMHIQRKCTRNALVKNLTRERSPYSVKDLLTQ
jgi:hypothetical protein